MNNFLSVNLRRFVPSCFIYCLLVSLLVGGDMLGVARSTDGGETWGANANTSGAPALSTVPTNELIATSFQQGTPAPNAPLNGDWALVFNDDFNSTSLNRRNWETCYWWVTDYGQYGCTNASNNELEWYQPDEVLVENGILRLRARARSMNGFPFTSGMVASQRLFYFQYGYMEIRARMPVGRGLWPAFWTLAESKRYPPEIDILEVLGHEPDIVHMTTHWLTETGARRQQGDEFRGPDFSADFHTFGAWWSNGLVVWYVDGVERFRVQNRFISAEPMHLLVNLAVGGDWAGSPDGNTVFPAYFDVDYVRVWQPSALQPAVLQGSASLQRRPSSGNTPLTVTVSREGTTLGTYPVTLDSSANFVLPALPPGIYTVRVKHQQSLSITYPVHLPHPGVKARFGVLRMGDVNDDNAITLRDFSLLASSFNIPLGQSGYNARADLNGDGAVTLQDYSILASNYNQVGQ